MQAVHILAVAGHAHQRSVACTHTVQRHILFRAFTGQSLLLDYRICREQGIAHGIEHLQRSVHGTHHQELFAFLFGVVYKYAATHSRSEAHIAGELGAVNASVIDADGHANLLRAKIHHAVAHKGIGRLFDTGLFRDIHLDLNTGVTALGCHGIRITRGPDGRHRIKSQLGILRRLAQVRQQVRTRAVIISIFAQGILEGLADAQNPISLHHGNAELVIAQGIATPEVCNAIFQGLTQVPIIYAPYDNAASRNSRIKAAHVNNNALCLLLVDITLFLAIHAILKNQMQTVYRHRRDSGIGAFIVITQRYTHLAILIPTALAVFNQQVFASTQGNLHDFHATASSRRRNFDSHGLASHRADFLHVVPAHVGTFPCSRHRGQETVARIVARKIHYIVITQAANALHHIVGIRESEFTGNLIHQNPVHAPVQPILRSGFTGDHN